MDNFETSDITLATTLVTLNFSVKDISGPVKVGYRDVFNFVFPQDDKIQEVVNQYNSNQLSIEPKKFMFNMRSLKRRMFEYSDKLQKEVNGK